MTNLDKRLIGEQNTLAILTNLHRFGWLTSRMLSALVWPTASQAPAMARRAVRSLVDDRLILRRPLPSGGDCYTLSASGARHLTEQTGIAANSGASLALGNPVHRACANWFVIHQMQQGMKVWTEHEIQTDRAPVVNVNGKVPDALLEADDGIVWVEVENAWKNRVERARIVSLACRYLPTDSAMFELVPSRSLLRMAIVATNHDALRSICRSFADAFHSGELSESRAADVDLHLLSVSHSLVGSEPVSGNLWYDALLPPFSD